MSWKLYYTKQSLKDIKKLKAIALWHKAEQLLKIVETNPFQNPPPYEKLTGDMSDAYSRRINIQHRMVYQVYEKEKAVKILRMWTHYE